MYLIKSITSAILLSYSLLASSTVAALDSDREQPIQIAADAAELNEGKGFSIYSGNVIITQGTMVIEASTVKITFDDNGIQTILATEGKHDGRAYMRQLSEGEARDLMEAWGQSIDYQIDDQLLTLLGNAKLIQKGNHFSGESIIFDIPNDNVKASGGNNGRVQMIFLPKSK